MNDPRKRNRLEDLDARLKAARESRKAQLGPSREERDAEGSAQGWAWRVAVEMVVGVAFGGYAGWLLDNWLGTLPWFLIVLFLLGAGAGMMNVYRAARQMNPAPHGEENGNSDAGKTADKRTDGDGGTKA